MSPDDESDKETISVRDLLNTLGARLASIDDGQQIANREQQQTNIHLATLNGTVARLQEQSTVYAGKLDDYGGVLTDHATRLAVVERVTEIRDEHLTAGVRDARSGAWEARLATDDTRTEVVGQVREIRAESIAWRQAMVTALLVAVVLLLVGGGLALLVFG